ncbi:hypothetical protein F5Y10DRAFT_238482 [Nemania abortiva]|nr:hypothetical protein F5Y10DRAFT_238482 [Nemania abortiva]
MEPRSGLRRYTQGPIRPPTGHYQHSILEAESSDEDDEDIPASKLPSVSPSKRLSISSPHVLVNPAKRSVSDVARGGIVLYPGSKRQRNGYNMPLTSRKSPPSSIISSSHAYAASIRTPSRMESLSPSPEDDIFEGLVKSVNDAIRHQQTRQTQDHGEQRARQAGASTPGLLNGINSGELEDGIRFGNQNFGSPPLILNGMNQPLRRNTHGELVLADTTPDTENRAETSVGLRVDSVLLPAADVWDVPNPPGQLKVQEELPNGSNQMLRSVKRRGRPPKLPKAFDMASFLPTGAVCIEKKGPGRPRKHYPRLRDETDSDHITHTAKLREELVPCVLQSDAHLPSQSSSAPHDTGLIQSLNQSGQISQDDGAQIPALGQGLSELLRYTRASQKDFQLAPMRGVQPKAEPEEDVAQPVNHVEPYSGDHDCDGGNGELQQEDNVAQYGNFDPDDNECSDSDANEDDGNPSDSVDGLGTDSGSDCVPDLSIEESFKHDVDAFNARQTRHTGDEIFEGPSDDDVIAVHLDCQPLRQLCKALGEAAWTGTRGNWQWRPFDYDGAETKPARAILSALAKLERLYQATPKAPHLKEQNRFLRAHASMIRYYFHKITVVIDHIRTRRLEIPEHNEAIHDTTSRKRKRMTRDLVLYVIPMLAHVLASAWGLGGKNWLKTSFTSSVVELLKRALGWIMALYPRLLGELKRFPLEEKPETERQQKAWDRRNLRREEVGPLIDGLCQVITAAPDQLAEAEERRERQLRREKQLEIEQKLAEEERQALVAERKKRSLLSIHGIHYRLQSSATSSRPPPSRPIESAEWSLEERRLLFLRIQASFPVCPDLNNLRWELNKTVAQMVAMTEEILEKMLAKVLVGYSPEERAAELREIMRSSGVAGL